jgi:hypothetical protein
VFVFSWERFVGRSTSVLVLGCLAAWLRIVSVCTMPLFLTLAYALAGEWHLMLCAPPVF